MTYSGSLARFSTRRLLEMKAAAYRCHGGDSENLRHGSLSEDYGYDPLGYSGWGDREVPIADIKTELAGREHVLNKQERKAARRAASRRGGRRTRGAR